MRRQFGHVEGAQPGLRQRALDHQQRQIGIMLVIDRVELHGLDQPQQMRELEQRHALRRQRPCHAGDEAGKVGNMREHVVGDQQIGADREPPCQRVIEERRLGRNAARIGDGGDVGGGLDAEHGDAARGEVLEQIAVVAGDLQHQRASVEGEARDHRLRAAPRMGHPARRDRGEIRVVGEDRVRRHHRIDLRQLATGADAHVQVPDRIGPLRRPLRRHQRVGERGGAEIDQAVPQFGAAQAAAR